MQSEEEHRALDVRGLFESTGTPFTAAAYEPGGVIFLQGDPCDSVMHIASGSARLVVTTRHGKEAICGLLGAGAFLGEEAIAGHRVRRQTAIAMTGTDVLIVATAHMLRLLRAQPAFADRFITHLLARHARLEADLSDQLLNSAEQRLAHTLLLLAHCDEGRGCPRVLPHISQEIIAEMVGTTRSRVSTFMGKFKKLGFIEEDHGVIRVNPSRLSVVHGGLDSGGVAA